MKVSAWPNWLTCVSLSAGRRTETWIGAELINPPPVVSRLSVPSVETLPWMEAATSGSAWTWRA